MNILSAEKISKSYSEKILFNEISLNISEGDKIGLIGINGTGKSTLLNIIAGVEVPDTGRIIAGNGISTEYLPQNPHFDNDAIVIQQVFKGNSPIMKLLREYEYILQETIRNPGDTNLQKKLMVLTQNMESMNAWTIESEAKTVSTKLGIFDFNANVGTLSGGQKKRVGMAGALINPCDLLILDEPTNHIDTITVDWLEKYLNKRRGALLMVTHDRYFLARVSNRIIELDNGKLYSYQANYDKYLEMKAEREELEQSSERKRQNLYKRELDWIKRGAKARSTKQKARIDRFEKLRDTQSVSSIDNIEIKTGASRLGKKTIEFRHIGKEYSGIEVIRDFSYTFLRDDRIGIIGLSGTGKSTLLKILAGRLEPDRGLVLTGDTIKTGFFAQENDELKEMDRDLRVIDYIRNEAKILITSEGTISASQALEKFLFPPAVQWTPVVKLSGGEKRRLYLLRILMGAPNVLILDEPTNDLDIQTLAILESYLDDFPGIVVAVSHDRYFLDRVADKIFLFEGNGIIKQFEGNYSFYFESVSCAGTEASENNFKTKSSENNFITKSGENNTKINSSAINPKINSGKDNLKANSVENNPKIKKNMGNTNTDKENSSQENKRDRPLKFTFNEQREFEQIDERIAELENGLKAVNLSINEASSDFERLQELLSRQELLENELNEAMERWIYLNELADEIATNRS